MDGVYRVLGRIHYFLNTKFLPLKALEYTNLEIHIDSEWSEDIQIIIFTKYERIFFPNYFLIYSCMDKWLRDRSRIFFFFI